MGFKSALLVPCVASGPICEILKLQGVGRASALEHAWWEQRESLDRVLDRISAGRPKKPVGRLESPGKMTAWAARVDAFDQAAAYLSEVVPNLLALGATLRSLDEGGLESELSALDPWLQVEVRVRLAWIDYHKDLLSRGQSVGYPFRGIVGGRAHRSRQRDREFATVILLLHWMAALEGRSLSFRRMGETPDFICSLDGVETGIEVTEATSEKRQARQRSIEATLERLENLALTLGVAIHLESRHDLADLGKVWGLAEAQVRQGAGGPLERQDSSFTDSGQSWKIEVVKGGGTEVMVSDSDGVTGGDVASGNAEAVALLRRAVAEKLAGPAPTARPCALAVYPNFLSEADLQEVLQAAGEGWSLGVASHFDEVWVVHEQGTQRLV